MFSFLIVQKQCVYSMYIRFADTILRMVVLKYDERVQKEEEAR